MHKLTPEPSLDMTNLPTQANFNVRPDQEVAGRDDAMASTALTFEQLLDKIENSAGEADNVTVADLLDAIGRRAYGPIILLLGFVAISPLTLVPGANWLVALITLVIAVQIVFGRRIPWVPQRALKASFPRRYLHQAVTAEKPWARRVDRFTRPRFSFLTESPFVQMIGLVCVGAALITFPLGLIPLGPVLPSLAILLLGVGLAARDGLFLILSGGALVGSAILLWRVGGRLATMVHGFF